MFYTVIRRNLVAKQMKKKKQSPPLSAEELAAGGQLGLDSHADMSCAGRHARIIEVVHGSLCNVKPFHDSYKSMEDIQTVNVSFAHDTKDGRTFILNMNQCLDFTDGMENSLLCPNQARDNGVIVNDIPKFLDPSGKSTHSIYFPMEDINLPLDMNGLISYLPVRYPSDNDLDHCQQLDLTSAINWDPSSFDGLNRGVLLFVMISMHISIKNLMLMPSVTVKLHQMLVLKNWLDYGKYLLSMLSEPSMLQVKILSE